jgi:hypothetical protein
MSLSRQKNIKKDPYEAFSLLFFGLWVQQPFAQ